MKEALNENIRALRKAAGYSQVEFADLLGVTKQCVSNWENDNVLPSIEMLLRIADRFRVSTDYLLGRECDTRISVEGLTEKQISHVTQNISDLAEANCRNLK